jgi:transcriptional regulator with XRE-family HTH domain
MQFIKQDINVGENLKKIRKNLKLTQPQTVAKMHLLGSTMSRSTYSNIEGGIRNIKVSDLIILKTIFNVEYDEIFDGLFDVSEYV